ncbi:tail fiber domain-containing protein [Shewanella woodyi]|uniref:tail fiber domain-containing protein n=1 Tax=Shewanella woodyi TaxID=60961 RepID=UPI0007EB9490|nr:tail fiber domain-containing protein [Shewanella woodyi]
MKNKTNKAFKLLPLTLAITMSMATSVQADQVILDDLIVDGSICTGMDCVNGESFGFDTLRLKENNLRIRFVDTSNSASFPSRDWQITANDSSNGGLNKFSIDDIDGAKTPFTIEAGAGSHSLYVDDASRVGFGTNAPVVQLHLKDGNTPTLRLEQDGSSGFTPQTWDVAGNESNFFIRDATNGSTLPFRIFPGAPSDSISIAADGDVGIGTTSPVGRFDVKSSDKTTTLLSVTDNGKVLVNSDTLGTYYTAQASLNLESELNEHLMIGLNTTDSNKSGTIAFQSNGIDKWMISSRHNSPWPSNSDQDRWAIFNQNAAELFTIHQDGKIFIGDSSGANHNTVHALDTATGAHLTTGGVWTNASSRDLKEKIVSLGEDIALETLKSLMPVTYMYKTEPGESYVGFIAEDVPSVVATNDRKSLASMDIVAVLTKVVQMQEQRITQLSNRLESIESK